MMVFVTVHTGATFYEVNLDGQPLKMKVYYCLDQDRYLMDLENTRMGKFAKGVVLNVGLDMLAPFGRLGLQCLVPVSFPAPRLEASSENFETRIRLVYMDITTYDDIIYGSDLVSPSKIQWKEVTPSGS